MSQFNDNSNIVNYGSFTGIWTETVWPRALFPRSFQSVCLFRGCAVQKNGRTDLGFETRGPEVHRWRFRSPIRRIGKCCALIRCAVQGLCEINLVFCFVGNSSVGSRVIRWFVNVRSLLRVRSAVMSDVQRSCVRSGCVRMYQAAVQQHTGLSLFHCLSRCHWLAGCIQPCSPHRTTINGCLRVIHHGPWKTWHFLTWLWLCQMLTDRRKCFSAETHSYEISNKPLW